MLNNFRESLKPHLEKLGGSFASTGLSPNFWTSVGLGFAFLAAITYGMNTYHLQYSVIIGGVLLLVSGFFDIVDGQVARFTKKTSKKGGFLDSVFDKIAEVAIFLGISTSTGPGRPVEAIWNASLIILGKSATSFTW